MNGGRISRHAFLVLCLLSVLVCAVLFSPAGSSQVKSHDFQPEVSRVLRHYDSLKLVASDTERQVRQTGRLTLETSAGTFSLLLTPNDVRSEDYRAIEIGDGGVERELPRAPSRTFKGTVEGVAGGQARFTIDSQTIEGLIIAGGEKFFVESATHYSQAAGADDFLFYRESDVISGNAVECHVQTLSSKVNSEISRSPSLAGDARPEVISPKREAEMATDADFEYVQAAGSSTAANNEILSIMNQVDGVYQTEIGLTFKIIFQRAWATSADPYDAGTLSGLLDQARIQWRDNPPAGTANRDIVHLWTGRDLDGFQTGLAYSQVTVNGVTSNGVVCRFQELAIGVSERQTIAPQKYIVPAHEIGHNFSAQHPEDAGHNECALTIMSGTVQFNTVNSFCQFSRDEITNYITNSGTCLATATTSGAAVQFASVLQAASETSGNAPINVTRTGDTTGTSSVTVRTVDDTRPIRCDDITSAPGVAFARCDYATTVQTITFAPGETTKTVFVPLIDDSYGEPNENVTLTLSNPANASLGTQSTTTLTITSNEIPGQTGPNPIFNTDFFVRMQYLDFLSREPEPGQPWSATLNNCAAGDTSCDRVSVSANFFRSQEFQLKGLFVFNFYKVSFGRLPTYAEIVADMSFVTGATTADLIAKKALFTDAWVQRTDFTATYPTAMSNTTFVDTLLGRYGLTQITTPDPAAPDSGTKVTLTRADLINRLNAGTNTRAQVVRAIANSDQVVAAEFNSAFVAMQYFGYLRRDPDTQGYNAWLATINANPADFRSMVNGFVNSQEYRLRFGPA
jgi:hypothetical protein